MVKIARVHDLYIIFEGLAMGKKNGRVALSVISAAKVDDFLIWEWLSK